MAAILETHVTTPKTCSSQIISESYPRVDVLKLSFFFIVGFDIRGLSIDSPDDVEGLDLGAAYVGKLLSAEQRGAGEGCWLVDRLYVEQCPSPCSRLLLC